MGYAHYIYVCVYERREGGGKRRDWALTSLLRAHTYLTWSNISEQNLLNSIKPPFKARFPAPQIGSATLLVLWAPWGL